jgi:hypothetical protein
MAHLAQGRDTKSPPPSCVALGVLTSPLMPCLDPGHDTMLPLPFSMSSPFPPLCLSWHVTQCHHHLRDTWHEVAAFVCRPRGMGRESCDTTLPSALQVALGRDTTPFCVAHHLLCAWLDYEDEG